MVVYVMKTIGSKSSLSWEINRPGIAGIKMKEKNR